VPAPNLTLVPPERPPPSEGPPPLEGGVAGALHAWTNAVAHHCGALAKLAALSDPRHFRSLWLADLRELTADALRSPPFLALMKFNLTLLARRTTPPSPP
jgi:hypothetical protein